MEHILIQPITEAFVRTCLNKNKEKFFYCQPPPDAKVLKISNTNYEEEQFNEIKLELDINAEFIAMAEFDVDFLFSESEVIYLNYYK